MNATETPVTNRRSVFAKYKLHLCLGIVGLFVTVLCVVAFFSVRRVQRDADQLVSENNLKQLAQALHKYNDERGRLPDHAIIDRNTGQPLLSWRVTLLPYLAEKELYDRIRLDQPWDSEHNRQFWDKMPSVYQLPGKPNDSTTYYQVFQGDGALFCNVQKHLAKLDAEGSHYHWRGTKFMLQNIPNGPQNTIFAVEAARSVNWMKPEDISFVKGSDRISIEVLGNHWGDRTSRVVLCDGTVRTLSLEKLSPKTLHFAIDPEGPEGVVPRGYKVRTCSQ